MTTTKKSPPREMEDIQTKEKTTPILTMDEVNATHENLMKWADGIKYFTNRGISPETLKTYKIGAKRSGNKPVLLFPYFDLTGQPLTSRYRYREGIEKNKVNGQKGVPLSPYIPPDFQTQGEEIFITEGESDTLTLASYGLNVLGVPGVQNFKSEWCEYFTEYKKAVICFDNDKSGIEGAKETSLKIHQTAPHIELYRIQIPESAGNDVNDYFSNQNSVEDFLKLKRKIAEDFLDDPALNALIEEHIKAKPKNYVFLSDRLNNEVFFHTYFLTEKQAIALLSNGKKIRIEKDKESKIDFFEYEGQKYEFKIPVLFPPSYLNRTDSGALKIFFREKPKKETLYSELLSILHDYYDFYCEEEKNIIATDIIHSYLLNAIGRTFYKLFDAKEATGKSTLQKLMSKLQFNGHWSGSITAPLLCRSTNYFQTAFNIDELDKLDKDTKEKIIGVLHTGYTKNGTYEIVDMNAKTPEKQVRTIYTFGTRSFSVNSGSFIRSFLSRCITINTAKNKRRVKNMESLSIEDEKRFQDLRNKLFVYTLYNWKAIIDSIENDKNYYEEKEKYGRPSDIYSIISGIHFHFTGEENMREYLLEKEEFENETGGEDERFFLILEYLADKAGKFQEDFIEINTSNLAEYLNQKITVKDEFKATPKSMVTALRKYRIIEQGDKSFTITSGDHKGSKAWKIKKKNVLETIKRSEFSFLKDKFEPATFEDFKQWND